VFVLSDATSQSDVGQAQLSGSGRSIPAFHLLEALESMPTLFMRFGGHKQAAGLTMEAGQLETFRRSFATFAAGRLQDDDLRPQYTVDADVSFEELSERCVEQVLSLGPFGFGNAAPVLQAKNVVVAAPPKVLKEGKHYSVPLRQRERVLFCKAWNFGDRAEMFTSGQRLDILFQVEDDAYSRSRGYGSWCAVLKDIRKASESGEETHW
jgi:single-stranded-DNA-specific exonuclease